MAVGSYIGQINIGNDSHAIGSTLFGMCNTPAGTAAKVATLTGFNSLPTGVTVHILFTVENTVSTGVTLKVGSTDAKPVTNPNGSLLWAANSIISFTYDGTTNWVINSAQIDTSNIQIDVSKLNNLSLGNITNEGKITGHPSSLVVTDSNSIISAGAAFDNTTDGTFLDNTGNWSTPDRGVTSITINTTSPLTGGSSTATTSIGNYTIGFTNQNANTILAGPISGAAAAPDFRALVDDDIPNTIARLNSPTFITPLLSATPTIGDNSHAIADTAFVIAEINSRLAANDAMLFKGTIGAVTGATINSLPTNNYQAGDTYRVVGTNGYSFGSGNNTVVCEEGDLIIAIKDGPTTGTSIIPGDWTVAQTNIDGALYMGSTYTSGSGQLLVAGSSGAINTSGFTIAQPTTAGQLLYASSASAYNILNPGTQDQVLTINSNGLPVWASAQDYQTHLYVNGTAAGATSNAAVTSGNTYIHLYDNSTKSETIQLIGSGGTTITTTDAGAITIKSKKYKSASLAYALNTLTLSYNDGNEQSETPSTATPVAVVSGGTLYIKSIAYSTAQFSTDVTEDTTT